MEEFAGGVHGIFIPSVSDGGVSGGSGGSALRESVRQLIGAENQHEQECFMSALERSVHWEHAYSHLPEQTVSISGEEDTAEQESDHRLDASFERHGDRFHSSEQLSAGVDIEVRAHVSLSSMMS